MKAFIRRNGFAFLLLCSALFFSCRTTEISDLPHESCDVFTIKDFPDAIVYSTCVEGILHAVVVGSFDGIRGHVILSHPCTPEQYEQVFKKLELYGGKYMGKTGEIRIDKKKYPNQTIYLSWYMSHDELEAMWTSLGLPPEE